MVMTMMPPRKPCQKRKHPVLAKPEEQDAKKGKRFMYREASDSPEESFDLPNFDAGHDPRADQSMHRPGSGPTDNSDLSQEEEKFQWTLN